MKPGKSGLLLLLFFMLALSACAEPTRISIVVDAPGRQGIIVEPHLSQYEQVYEITGGDGSQTVAVQEWERIMELFGRPRGEMTHEEKTRHDRWRQQFEVHWPNIDAFQEKIDTINLDQVIDREESKEFCFLKPQWTVQFTSAKEYVENYRQVEPNTVAQNPGLSNLESEAVRALKLLDEATCDGPAQSSSQSLLPAISEPHQEVTGTGVIPYPTGNSAPVTLTPTQACYQNLDCRLDTSVEEMIKRFSSGNWTLEERQQSGEETMFIASHFENQISVVWFGYNGIASIQIIISPPPTFDTGVPVSIEAAVRAVTTLAIPQPWEFDIPNRIINEWYSLHMSPPEYREPLYSYFNGVSVQTSYSTEHNEVSVLFQKRMPTEEE